MCAGSLLFRRLLLRLAVFLERGVGGAGRRLLHHRSAAELLCTVADCIPFRSLCRLHGISLLNQFVGCHDFGLISFLND